MIAISNAQSDSPGRASAVSQRPETTKRVLIVAYHFPPDAEVGAIRAQKLVKYLPRCGWEPLVLTVDTHHNGRQDPTRLEDVMDAKIWRTGVLPNPRIVALAARRSLRRVLRSVDGPGTAPTEVADLPFEVKDAEATGIRAQLRRFFLSLCWLPDADIGWLPPALAQGLRILRRERPDAILTTSPPHTAHLVGLWLSRITGLPWIADFRDPWTSNPSKPRFVRSGLSDALDRRMERAVVRRARAVVVTTDRLRDQLVAKYKDVPATRFITAPNGFDPEDFATLPRIEPSASFLITHVGSLYYRRSALKFLEATAGLVRSGEIPLPDLRIVFVGDPPEDGRDFRDAVHALGLDGAVEWVGNVAQREALSWMLRSNLLLVFAQHYALQIPAKTFEYLASGAPILAVTEEGATADLISRLGGYVAHDAVAGITRVLRHCYVKHRTGTTRRVAAPWFEARLSEFDRRRIAAQFATALDKMIG
jgi:glycosyltransferase involved in cell wall biosynthesis